MNIYEKLAAIQQELIAPKNQFNKFGNYSYRSCEDILEGLKPCLKKVNAAVKISDEIIQIGDRYYIQATANLIDCESGESISNTALAREEDSKKGMDSSQLTGSTSSYARKYALNGLFCIDDVKDADSRDNSAKDTKSNKENATSEADRIAKVNEVMSALKEKDIDVEIVKRLYKVDDLRTLDVKKCDNIMKHLEDIKKKQEESKNE
ncbi:MAG: ERF family protein [Lachnospiraceae bacterium]